MEIQQKLMCTKHNGQEIEYLNVNCQSDQILKCVECVIKQNLDQKDLVLIDQCLLNHNIQGDENYHNDEDQDQIIINWPPRIESDLNQNINQLLQNCNIKESFKAKAFEYFDRLEKRFNDTLTQAKKKAIIEIENFEIDTSWALKAYNDIAERKELSELIRQHQNDQVTLNSKLKEFISQITNKSDENNKKVGQLLEEYRKSENLFLLDYSEIILELIIEQVQSISFISKVNQDKLNNNNNNNNNQQQLLLAEQLQQQNEILNSSNSNLTFKYDSLIKFLYEFQYEQQHNLSKKRQDLDQYLNKMDLLSKDISSYHYAAQETNFKYYDQAFKDITTFSKTFKDTNLELIIDQENVRQEFNSKFQKIFKTAIYMIPISEKQIEDLIPHIIAIAIKEKK